MDKCILASFVYLVHILYILYCKENILYFICNNICVVLVSDSNKNKYYVHIINHIKVIKLKFNILILLIIIGTQLYVTC